MKKKTQKRVRKCFAILMIVVTLVTMILPNLVGLF